MSWLNGSQCALCPEIAIMAFLDSRKQVLTRLCESHVIEAGVSTEYEVWRGDYLENETTGKPGDRNREYLIQMDRQI